MPNPDETGAARCPSCGAPIESVPALDRCAFCGTVLRRRVVATTVAPASKPQPYRFSSSTQRLILAYLATGVVIIVAGGIAALKSRSTTAAGSLTPSGPLALLGGAVASSNGIGEPLGVVARAPGEYDLLTSLETGGHALGLFAGKDHALAWKAGAFEHTASPAGTEEDAENAYVVDAQRLSAFRLKDGVPLWQTSLVTGMNTSCDGCLRALGGRVIALQKDGSLQAFDATNGQLAWTTKIDSMPARLPVAGKHLVIQRPIHGRGNGMAIDLIDPADGTTTRTLEPSCLNRAFHRPERPDGRSPLYFDRDGRTMYVIFGFFSHCAQAWDVTTGQLRWTTYVENWSSTGRSVMGDRALLFGSGGRGVAAIDLATGKARPFLEEKDHSIVPLYVLDDLAIVKAAPNWDSNRVALWAVGLSDGRRLWQFPLSAKHASMSDFMQTYTVRPTPAGLIVVQQMDDEHVSVDVLNLRTGVSPGRKMLATGNRQARPYFRDDIAWLQVRDGLDAVRLPAGEVAYHLR